MAAWLNERGATAVMLKYRVPQPRENPQGAYQDGQRAVSLVRSKAQELGIDSEQIGMIGFSAGGGVAEHALLNPERRSYEAVDDIDTISCRLNFAVMVYTCFNLGDRRRAWASECSGPQGHRAQLLGCRGRRLPVRRHRFELPGAKRAMAPAEVPRL